MIRSRIATVVLLVGVVLAATSAVGDADAQPSSKPPPIKLVAPNLRVRLVRPIDPNLRVNFKGKELTVRQFQDLVPADEVVDLPGGGRAKVQELLDGFEDLKTKSGGSFARLPTRRAFDPARLAQLQHAPAQVEASTRAPRQGADSRWNDQLLQLRRIHIGLPPAGKLALPPLENLEDGSLLPQPGPLDDASPMPPLDALAASAPNMVPAQAPFFSNWEVPYGPQDLLGGYESFVVGGSYFVDKNAPAVLCLVGSEAGIHILGKQIPLAKLVQAGAASQTESQAKADLLLFGSEPPIPLKTGNYANFTWTRAIDRSLGDGWTVPLYPPFAAHIRASGRGLVGVQDATLNAGTQGSRTSCESRATAILRLEVTFTGTPALLGPPPKFWTFIEKFFAVGVKGRVGIVDRKVIASTALALTRDPSKQNTPTKLTEAASLVMDARFLDGSFSIFLRLGIPDNFKWLTTFIGEPSFEKEWVLFSWAGFPSKHTLASVPQHDILFVKK